MGRQSLDFYLPDYNVAIECQGMQHFEEIEHFGGKQGFDECIKRDNLKKDLCAKHNIKLLYYANYEYNFPYEVITDKNILSKIISNEKENKRRVYSRCKENT